MKNKYFTKLAAILGLLQLTLFSLPTHAQQGFSAYDVASKANNYYPASVSASQLFKKPAEDIDYATGQVTIRIPIYEIHTADFTLPISLYYITSGIKMNQLNGPVAVGWQLDAEPMITRMTRGKPDEMTVLSQGSQISGNSESYQMEVGKGNTDPMQDIFYYRLLNGKNGKFILEDSNRREFIPKLLNSDDIALTASTISNTDSYSLSLTNTDGTKYVFGGDQSAREITIQPFNNTSCATSWKASSITSVNGDRLQFSYRQTPVDEYPYSHYDFYTLETFFEPNPQNTTVPDVPGIPPHPGYWKGVDGKMNYYYLRVGKFLKWKVINDEPYHQPNSHVETRPIERIDYDGGSVHFFYEHPSPFVFILKRIEVYSGDKCIRTVRLTSNPINNDTKDLFFLNKVEICGTDSNVIQKYSFKYRPSFDKTNRNAVDYWGYYNAEQNNTDLVPKLNLKMHPEVHLSDTLVDFTIGGSEYKGNNYTSADYMLLNEVTYPSGGTTQYYYTPNSIYPTDIDEHKKSTTIGGGARISSILETPVSGKPIYRRFKYGKDCNFEGYGFSRFPVTPESFCQKLEKHYLDFDNYGYCDINGKSVTYSNLLNEQVDDKVYYRCVGEEVNGVISVHYNHFEDVDPRFPPDIIDVHDKLAIEDSCVHHKRLLNRPLETVYSMPKVKYAIVRDIKPFATFENLCGSYIPSHLEYLYVNSYTTREVDLVQRMSDLTETGNRYHDEKNGTMLQERETRSYAFPGLVSNINSDQEQISIKYSGMESPTGAFKVMQQKNVLSVPTETKHYIDGTLRKHIRYNYDTNSSTNCGYSLSSIEESTGVNGQMRTVETYDAYLPCGKSCQITRIDGSNIAIVWSYGGKYPIAIAEGLQASDLTTAGIDLKAVATTHNVNESVYTILEGLRGRYPNARINTYRYQPEAGIIRKTTSDGIAEHYSYDPAGRLEEVKDNQLRTILNYEYHEANQ